MHGDATELRRLPPLSGLRDPRAAPQRADSQGRSLSRLPSPASRCDSSGASGRRATYFFGLSGASPRIAPTRWARTRRRESHNPPVTQIRICGPASTLDPQALDSPDAGIPTPSQELSHPRAPIGTPRTVPALGARRHGDADHLRGVGHIVEFARCGSWRQFAQVFVTRPRRDHRGLRVRDELALTP